mgnify:CR=1 FL=1
MLIPTFETENTQNQTIFHAKILRSTFGFQCRDVRHLLHNANVVINIGHFQHQYVGVKSLRKFGRISNILLHKTLQ